MLADDKLAENIDLDAPIPFEFQHLQNYLHNLNNSTWMSGTDTPALEDGETEDWFTRRMKFRPTEARKISGMAMKGELDRLVLRVESRIRDPRYAFMFQYTPTGDDELPQIIKELSGFMGKKSAPVTVFDLSYLRSETIGVVVATIS